MKKLWLFGIITILFIALFLMPMAWGVLDADDLAQFERNIAAMRYKEDLFIPAADRLEYMRASADSRAGQLYQLFLGKKAVLPSENDFNWAEKMYYEHELEKYGWQKAVAQIKKS